MAVEGRLVEGIKSEIGDECGWVAREPGGWWLQGNRRRDECGWWLHRAIGEGAKAGGGCKGQQAEVLLLGWE